LLLEDLARLKQILTEKSREYKDCLMIGRTHGVHAEPVTFGLKLLIFREEGYASDQSSETGA
jgi:adenylosuccinate lyase